jgi:lipopolysaccharide exporter
MAARGFGAWSLVANILIGASLQTIVFCSVLKPRFSWRIDWALLRKVLAWGLPLTGGSLLWQFWENSDYLVVGKVLGPVALGQYTMAYRLATVANDKISSVVNRVSFPSFSAMQEELAQVVQHWFSLTRKLCFVTVPVLVALALNANDFISIVLGSKWLPAASLVKVLCVMGALKSLSSINLNVLCARGRTDLVLYFSLLSAVLLPASFALGCHYASLMGVAVGWCIIYPIVSVFAIVKAAQLTRVRVRDYFHNLSAPAGVAALCLLSMLPISWFLPAGILRLAVRCGVGLAAFAVSMLLQPGVKEWLSALWSGRNREMVPCNKAEVRIY